VRDRQRDRHIDKIRYLRQVRDRQRDRLTYISDRCETDSETGIHISQTGARQTVGTGSQIFVKQVRDTARQAHRYLRHVRDRQRDRHTDILDRCETDSETGTQISQTGARQKARQARRYW
jgi:hypothetical protein